MNADSENVRDHLDYRCSTISLVCRLSIVLLLRGYTSSVSAETHSPPPIKQQSSAKVCTGFDSERQRWGPVKVDAANSEANCPSGSAIMAYALVARSHRSRAPEFPIEGYCCPLPDGALTSEHTFDEETCPEGSVVTGGKQERTESESPQGREKYLLRCTRLNSVQFRLASTRRGRKIGGVRDTFAENVRHLLGDTTDNVTWSEIPLALRYGILRVGPAEWESGGCIGASWGAVLVSRSGSECRELSFREILPKINRGEDQSTSSQSIRVYPECDALSAPFAADASCLNTTPQDEQAANEN